MSESIENKNKNKIMYYYFCSIEYWGYTFLQQSWKK